MRWCRNCGGVPHSETYFCHLELKCSLEEKGRFSENYDDKFLIEKKGSFFLKAKRVGKLCNVIPPISKKECGVVGYRI